MTFRLPVAALFLLLFSRIGGAADHQVWLIGGGPDVFASQAQIEANVLWARQVAQALPGHRTIRVWFNDGDDPAPDVTEWQPSDDSSETLQPLARVFNSYWSNGEHYRNHRLGTLVGSTEALRLNEELGQILRAMQDDDEGWLIFNGHGRSEDDLDNTIELWNSTWLTASDVSALLQLAPKHSRIRFLFTQCFAGAFTRLSETGEKRCGFVAEAADREAEGCSAAIDQDVFEDYSSHFFAALAGATRFGDVLEQAPDRDGDQRVSPLEAHYYTLLAADSADIPRATSEALLEQWSPWYLRPASWWMGNDGSVYQSLADSLMKAAEIDSLAKLAALRHTLEAEREHLLREQQAFADESSRIREYLEAEVLRRWPRAGFVYTLNFKHFLEHDSEAAQAFIMAHADFPRLSRMQNGYWELQDRLLRKERDLTRLEKIEHLLKLDAKLKVLKAFGPSALYDRYQQLLDCESQPF